MDKLNAQQLAALLAAVAKQLKETKGLRYGQSLFNIGEELYPDLVKPLRGSEIDCFHIQKNINPFLKAISHENLHEAIDMDFY